MKKNDTATAAVSENAPPPRKITVFDTAAVMSEANATARYLAGLEPEPGSPLAKLISEPAFQVNKQYFDRAFSDKSKALLDSLNLWAEKELKTERSNADQTIFYPFAGADFVTIHTLFPDAKRYVLFGLEPEGIIPPVEGLSAEQRNFNLQNYRVASDAIMKLSFFMTNNMRDDFRRGELKGTLPTLLQFVARQGNEVINVHHVSVQNDGSTVYSSAKEKQNPDDSIATGYRVKFRKNAQSPIQTLDYFSVNVHDPTFKKNKGFQLFLDQLKPAVTYIKSASYLLHKSYFSVIHDKIQDVSEVILQDDSGFPIRSFKPEAWDVTFYGVYSDRFRPIPLFANLYQADLTRRYKEEGAAPLPFGIGYQYRKGTSNLLKAKKKNEDATPKRKSKE